MERSKSLAVALLAVVAASTALSAVAGGGKGLTWRKINHLPIGVDHVGCGYSNGANECDPYVGDTVCSTRLPVLCVKEDGSPVPTGVTPDFYNSWGRGNIALTRAVRGDSMTSLADANAVCRAELGPGYKIAGHGYFSWYGYAYGNIDSTTRFWAHIADQPGNCWNP
ncbi:hypothetical protein [Lysobacter sp. CA199]|uniref:hypothetical protein n=1 Tax=Lysobacter sp. CA199 TaxID=3455608 RepID=UPI003F8D587B